MTEWVDARLGAGGLTIRVDRRRSASRADLRGRALARRACLLAGVEMPPVQRHPERPHPSLGRGHGRGPGLCRTPRPATPTAARSTVRVVWSHASTAAGASRDRARRHDHGPRRPLAGQAAQQPERRRRACGRHGLVHRPELRDRTDYEGDRAESEIGGCHVFRIDPTARVEVVADDFVRPNGLAFSADESQLYVATPGPATSGASTVSARGRADRRRGLRRRRRCRPTTGFVSTRRVVSGSRPRTASTASTRTGRCSGSSSSRRSRPILTFGGPKRNVLFVTASWAAYTLRLNVCGIRYPA